MTHRLFAALSLCLLLGSGCRLLPAKGTATARQQSLDEWRSLTTGSAQAPRVFVKGDKVQFYFPTDDGVEAFSGVWSPLRVPTSGFRANSAMLRWDQKLERMPEGVRGWREATVIAGERWRRLTTNLMVELTPKTPGHGCYYEAFLSGRLFYRDQRGVCHLAASGEYPTNIVVEHRFPIPETLEVVGRVVERHLAQDEPHDSLFVLMAPSANRFVQPLLVDRQEHQVVFLTPAAVYDYAEAGLGLTATGQGLSALFLESHGLALVKNPVSSAARLGDLGLQTIVRFIHLPLPKSGGKVPPIANRPGMGLKEWEEWLDRYTGTQLEDGSLRLLIDGDHFYPRIQEAIARATNHVYLNLYIFDKDDVGVGVADELKRRADDIKVKVIFDRLGAIAAGTVPPSTPMAEEFEPPSSIWSYLEQGSHVKARPFLDPWFVADHSKLFLVDGTHAWMGGMNLGREYRYEWHDLMVEMTGPVVGSLEETFDRKWAHAGLLGDLAYAVTVLRGPEDTRRFPADADYIPVRRLPTRTFWKPFGKAVLNSMDRAQSYIYAENPYLFDRQVLGALVRARLRGVDVRVILPRENDFKAGGRSNLIAANYLLENGVRVFFYPGMTHVKALMVDDWSCVGSGNLNHLSLRVCQEDNVATSDAGFAAQLKHQLFEEDFGRSYELTQPVSVDWEDVLADLVLENF